MDPESPRFRAAREDFRHARRQGAMKEIIARLTGRPADLLPFEEVRRRLRGKESERRGLQQIPLDAIIGSVGRYADFTRDFLPRYDSDANRWVRVRAHIRDLENIPPIDVYQIGEAFFVLDGNHRVSIARERGQETIPAYVTLILTKVSLTPETDLDDLIIKAEYVHFLEKTHLDERYPNADLTITVPGRYTILEKQIDQHQHELSKGKKISYSEAVSHWYTDVYTPIIKMIRARGILRDFPNRTETDLYVWIAQNKEILHRNLGWKLESPVAATDLIDQYKTRSRNIIAKTAKKLRNVFIPPIIEPGPPPGAFRRRQNKIHAHDPAHLFTHMLMPLSGEVASWNALELGVRLAWREEARLMGLHIVPHKSDLNTPKTKNIRKRFEQRCNNAGIPGEMAFATGEIATTISKRARLSDLVIIHLAHPPKDGTIYRVESGIRKLIQHCPRPILAIPQVPENIERLLVAYNGNPKSTEALYAAAYFAGRWVVPLYVLTVAEPENANPKIISQAKDYLESRQVPATFIQEDGSIADTILDTAKKLEIDLLFMGGYSRSPVMEMILGSPLDHVLGKSQIPVLICR